MLLYEKTSLLYEWSPIGTEAKINDKTLASPKIRPHLPQIYLLIQDIQGNTAIHDAIISKNNSGVAFLCGAPNINLKICNGRGLSPLHLAAMKDDEL